MSNDLCFNETVQIYPLKKSAYGNDVPSAPTTVPAIFEQLTGSEHSNSQDVITSSSRLYLPGDDAFVTSRAYRLEGLVVGVNPFGAPSKNQYFRITGVTPIRDILACNQVRHVECELQKIGDFKDVC